MNIDYHKFPVKNVLAHIQHYDAEKYWRRRDYVINMGGTAYKAMVSPIYKTMRRI